MAKPESLLHLSALYFEAGKFKQSVQTAAEAIRLRPNYPEAYNNMAAGYAALGDWDLAIQASREALRIRPGYRMAIQNLARSEGQKRRSMAP